MSKKLQKLPRLESKPRYIQMDGYKNYKYQSYYLDLMGQGKKGQKYLSYHLQTSSKSQRKRYELNEDSKKQLLYRSRLDNVFTDSEHSQREVAISLAGSAIADNYNRALQNYSPEPLETSQSSVIEINNEIITRMLDHQKKLTLKFPVSRSPYKEMNTVREFKILVKNTQEFLKCKGKPITNNYILQFILMDVYFTFKNLDRILQERILLAFGINPHDDEDIIYYDQFSKFKQIIIAQNYKAMDLVQFFVKFFNPQNAISVPLSDIRALLTIILQNADASHMLPYFMKNIQIAADCDDVQNLKSLFLQKVVDPMILIQLLLNQI